MLFCYIVRFDQNYSYTNRDDKEDAIVKVNRLKMSRFSQEKYSYLKTKVSLFAIPVTLLQHMF